MEFYENQARRPFRIWIVLGRAARRAWRRRRAKRALRNMNDHVLRDIGLNRRDLE